MVLQEANKELIDHVGELLLNEMASFGDVCDLQVWCKLCHDAIFEDGLDPGELEDIIFLPHDNKHRDLESAKHNSLDVVPAEIRLCALPGSYTTHNGKVLYSSLPWDFQVREKPTNAECRSLLARWRRGYPST